MIRSTVKNLKRTTKENYISMDLEGYNYDTETVGFRKGLAFIERFYDNDGVIRACKVFMPNRKRVFFLA